MKENTSKLKLKSERHYFFLNPYDDMAFTRCPKCEEKTKIRKHCLIIHMDPKQLFSINKICRYCTNCDLIIVKQTELESLLAVICEQHAPELIGNDYFVFGTLDRKDWKDTRAGTMIQQEALKRSHPFKDAWKFEIAPAGWYRDTK